MKRSDKINRKSAFTLVELLCVFGIIAILVALYLGVFPKAIGRARKVSDQNADSQTNMIKMMQEDENEGH
ncbi:MAG: type II secretion system protein [Verrucomicrobiota bacterium]|jgi:prepilin-type N-terminal cleavage/methylation domain-containing protein